MGVDWKALEQELSREAEESPEDREKRLRRYLRRDRKYLSLEKRIAALFRDFVAPEKEHLDRLYEMKNRFGEQREAGNWDHRKQAALKRIERDIRETNARRHNVLHNEIGPLKAEKAVIEEELTKAFNKRTPVLNKE